MTGDKRGELTAIARDIYKMVRESPYATDADLADLGLEPHGRNGQGVTTRGPGVTTPSPGVTTPEAGATTDINI